MLVGSTFGAILEDPEGGFIKFGVKRASKQDQTLHMEGKLHVILYFREVCRLKVFNPFFRLVAGMYPKTRFHVCDPSLFDLYVYMTFKALPTYPIPMSFFFPFCKWIFPSNILNMTWVGWHQPKSRSQTFRPCSILYSII